MVLFTVQEETIEVSWELEIQITGTVQIKCYLNSMVTMLPESRQPSTTLLLGDNKETAESTLESIVSVDVPQYFFIVVHK
mmetsp:Transcript_31558/g.63727  ORF Transcript_31558/g.63727 Transcript_31558/m.63727 type:complete len:80 (-) Transcript_31558:3038-3277(-)